MAAVEPANTGAGAALFRVHTQDFVAFTLQPAGEGSTGPPVASEAVGFKPAAARALPGDTVARQASGGFVLVRRAAHPPLPGTLVTASATRYGYSAAGAPRYLFLPFDAAYPPLRVAWAPAAGAGPSAAVAASRNLVALASFAAWQAPDVLPTGGLVRVLGVSGEPEAEVEAALLFVAPRSYADRGVRAWLAAEVEAARERVAAAVADGTREDLRAWPVTLNIDPPGCRDVDDVVSLRPRRAAGEWDVAISIADVGVAVPAGSPLDAFAAAQAQSVYVEGRGAVRPMLPPALSESALSLLADGAPRPALSLIAVWSGGALHEARLVRSVVVNRRACTYDSVEADLAGSASEAERAAAAVLPRVALAFRGGSASPLDPPAGPGPEAAHEGRGWARSASPLDPPAGPGPKAAHEGRGWGGTAAGSPLGSPHEWVEAFMVAFNVAAGAALRRMRCGLLRAHTAPDAARLAAWTALDPALARFAHTAAVYAPGDSSEGLAHFGLGAALYAHASSPLRRYADLVNSRLLGAGGSAGSGGGAAALPLAEHLNRRGKAVRAFERDVFFIQAIAGGAGTLLRAEGCVVEVLDAAAMRVHVPAWERLVWATWRGEGADEAPPLPGQRVALTAYCDLSARDWKRRVVTVARRPLAPEAARSVGSQTV